MSNILVIIKKELKRFFTDKRILASLIMPGVLIFVLYSIMGSFMGKIGQVDEDYTYQIAVVNEPTNESFLALLETEFKYESYSIVLPSDNLEKSEIIKEYLHSKKYDLVVVYDEEFYENTIASDPTAPNETKPLVELHYDQTLDQSASAFNNYYMRLNLFSDSISTKFIINASFDYSTNDAVVIKVIVSLVPFLLITFLFSGAMSISIEAIAGEKERGTMSTLLATPVKRSNIALGKIIALSIVSLVSATSSFLGLMLSLPKLMGSGDFDFNVYGVGDYILLFVVIISTILLFVVLLSMASAYAKSVKEATSLSSMLMIPSMLIGITSMIGLNAQSPFVHMIPIFNSVQSITSILSLEVNAVNLIVTTVTNLIFVGLGVFALTKMFDSEKVMFNK